MEKYDSIGKTYDATRKADFRITKTILDCLGIGDAKGIVAEIGAGTGNYTYELAKQGLKLLAVEPSEIMIQQGKKHANIEWCKGKAEQIPIEAGSVDGVICILATHHFTNLEKSLNEMYRILKSKGKMVIFTFDPRLCSDECWFSKYFPKAISEAYEIHPPIDHFQDLIESIVKNDVKVIDYSLPCDLEDGFFFSGWRKPELYLNEAYCAGISSLAKLPKEELTDSLTKLRLDLESGKWEEKYGKLLQTEYYDCGYRFLVANKDSHLCW